MSKLRLRISMSLHRFVEEFLVNIGATVMGRNSLVPTLLGSGERPSEGVGDDLRGPELGWTVTAPGVTPLEFRRTELPGLA